MRRLPALCTAVAASGAALLATAVPAAAAPARTPVPFAHVDGSSKLAANVEASVAGYVATFPGATRRSAIASFIVPTVNCTQRTQSPLFINFGLYGTTIGRNGTFDYVAGELTVTCTAGVAYYEAAASTNPERSAGAVTPGDKLTVQLLATRASTSVTLTDTTTGGVFRSTGNGITATTAQASVQGGFEGQSFPRPSTVQFQGIKIDNAALATWSPTGYDEVSGGTLLLETSPLTVNGLAFTVKFRSQP